MEDMLEFSAEEMPKNWNGMYWQAYKFVVQMVFQEAGFMDIAEGTIDESKRSDSECEEKFNKNQTKIMRLIGTTVPSKILHQIRDKITGTKIWEALYDLFEQG
ncbi:Multidrug resistance protein ABC Superfamily [Phytophthora palmivora]|uniref:Multidrug resistance protein ABC Superfamily n=1 Tax=Phytophthora palmivora TaxID=4796 RepID=A0A2P4XVP7_9STRA|nr:Multidrug resistance protein ABC Superfamily [Phytophthora palmivora]